MLSFNQNGLLVPSGLIESTAQELEEVFVIDYSSVERSGLFESYKQYSDELKALCGVETLQQWVNGSFTTHTTPRPSDIDLVTFIDAAIFRQLGISLEPFVYPKSKTNYFGIDGYIVPVYEEGNSGYFAYQSDRAYWYDRFDRSRRNPQGEKLPKGFVQLNY